jgi:cytochrome oxidase Cu insertion factor (SCO1/SenC/PrrC family)
MRQLGLLVAVAMIACSLGATPANAVRAPSPSIGVVLDRTVPAAITTLPLQNQAGQDVTLGQYRGKVLLVAPFLTSCQEECPIATGALLAMQHAIRADGLAKKVVLVEVTVDPGRDTPARMNAFAQMTGSTWPLLTGSRQVVATLWKYFGVFYQQVAESKPPGIDWETGQPYTYDVDHTDGFVLLNAQQHERFVAGGMVHVSSIPARLRRLLDSQGESNLRHPGGGSWTIPQGLDAIGWVLGRSVPLH